MLVIMNLAVIDDPFGSVYTEQMKQDLTDLIVTDKKKEEIRIDADYYFLSDEYNSRMKFMTLLAAGDIDSVIIPQRIFNNYLESEAYADLSVVMGADKLAEYDSYIVRINGKGYALDVSAIIKSILGVDTIENYYLACISNSEHQENFTVLADYLFGRLNK